MNTTITLCQLSEWRREFHKYAEPGWMEMRTSSRIARILTEMGYEVRMGDAVCDSEARMGVPDPVILENHYEWALDNGGDPEFLPFTRGGMTGVIAELDLGSGGAPEGASVQADPTVQADPIGQADPSASTGPTILLRFDMDALGVQESRDADHKPEACGFGSVTDGIMHACGHDGHTAIGLGVAKAIMENRDKLSGRIILIFQPAEEGVRGARALTEGYLKGEHIKPDYSMAAHIFPVPAHPEADVVIVEAGKNLGLATIKIDAEFHGKAAHAGIAPQEGNNAMLAAASAVLNLHAMPRYGAVPTQINVGTLHAGTGRNVVCDSARLEMEVRGQTMEVCQFLADRAEQILAGAAAMQGCSVETSYAGMAPDFYNSPELASRAYEALRTKSDLRVEMADHGRTMSEDYAYYARYTEDHGGETLFLTLRGDCPAANHNERFDFNEEVLLHGVESFRCLINELAGKK